MPSVREELTGKYFGRRLILIPPEDKFSMGSIAAKNSLKISEIR